MSNTILRFACGATYDTRGPVMWRGKPTAMLTYVHGDKLEPPVLDGVLAKSAPCLFGCPAPVSKSKRKQFKAWFGEKAIRPDGDPVWCVKCRPVVESV